VKRGDKMNYKPLVEKVFKHYIGEIDGDDLNDFFKEWAKINNYPIPKMVRFLKDMPCNSADEIVPIIEETEGEVYYNDGCHRWCCLYKKDEGIDFEYVK
jgi:hypothetical protein